MSKMDTATAALPGEILAGKYRIERLIGEGAMGTVMAARHLQLEQYVAIKFLRPELAEEPAIAERFRREAKAAARIKGEHVVRVFDVGELESRLPYLVMEYVEGMNLAEVIAADGRLPPATAIDYVLQACDALAQAHAAGVVHRDIKPSNLFVSNRPDGKPLVKVLDFGISKVSGALAAVTHPAVVMGSPLYMSPEQLMSPRDVDGRSDIWSLGIVLYELLTGTLPFLGDTIAQICVQIRETPVPSLRKRQPELTEDLEAVVLRCLEKDPALRYATISDLVSALRACAAYAGDVVASAIEETRPRGNTAAGPRRRSYAKVRAIVASTVLVGSVLMAAGLGLFYRGTSDPVPSHTKSPLPSSSSSPLSSSPSPPPPPPLPSFAQPGQAPEQVSERAPAIPVGTPTPPASHRPPAATRRSAVHSSSKKAAPAAGRQVAPSSVIPTRPHASQAPMLPGDRK